MIALNWIELHDNHCSLARLARTANDRRLAGCLLISLSYSPCLFIELPPVDCLLVTPHPIGERSIVMSVSVFLSVCVWLSAIITSELHVQSSPNFFCMLPMAVARSSSGGVVICYILPVLWMTSYLLIRQGCSTSPPTWSAVHTQPWAWL